MKFLGSSLPSKITLTLFMLSVIYFFLILYYKNNSEYDVFNNNTLTYLFVAHILLGYLFWLVGIIFISIGATKSIVSLIKGKSTNDYLTIIYGVILILNISFLRFLLSLYELSFGVAE